MSLNRMFKSKQTKLFSRAFALSVAPLARLVCVLCPFLMPPIDHMSCRGALEYLKFVSSSVMVTLAQLPTVTAWVLWVPSVCSCPAYRGIWQNKECYCGWLSWCSAPGNHCEWSISVLLRVLKPCLPNHSNVASGQGLVSQSCRKVDITPAFSLELDATLVQAWSWSISVFVCFSEHRQVSNAPWSTSSTGVPHDWHCHLVTAPKSLFLELWFFRQQRNHSTMMWYWALTRLHIYIYMLRA